MISHLLAENLLHFKADQADYSIKLEDHCTKLLFVRRQQSGSIAMLNEFFVYVFFKVLSWQSMSEFHVTTLDNDKELILNSTYQALASSKSGP